MRSEGLKNKENGKEIVTCKQNGNTCFHHVDHIDEVTMYFSGQRNRNAALLEAQKETYRENLEVGESKHGDNAEIKSSSSKITPCIFYTSDENARLRWSSDLHDCFVNAVEKLGGPDMLKSMNDRTYTRYMVKTSIKPCGFAAEMTMFTYKYMHIKDQELLSQLFMFSTEATPKSVKDIMDVEGIALHHVKSHLQKFRLGKCNIRDGTDQYNRCFKTARGVTRTYASSNEPRPQVKVNSKIVRTVKPKKEKEVQGSLYMRIEHDLYLQRCREAERMQMALAIENQSNMLETQYLKTSMTSEQPTIIPQTTTNSIENLCNNNMACLSLCDAQGCINPHMIILQQSMPGSSTHQPLHLNYGERCLIHDSYHNVPTTDSLNITNRFPKKTQSRQAYIPHHMYNSYPPYNTLEVVKAQLNALQNSSTSISRIQDTTSREDEIDPVEKYIDWGKVEETDIELDPIQILEALGFGVSS